MRRCIIIKIIILQLTLYDNGVFIYIRKCGDFETIFWTIIAILLEISSNLLHSKDINNMYQKISENSCNSKNSS